MVPIPEQNVRIMDKSAGGAIHHTCSTIQCGLDAAIEVAAGCSPRWHRSPLLRCKPFEPESKTRKCVTQSVPECVSKRPRVADGLSNDAMPPVRECLRKLRLVSGVSARRRRPPSAPTANQSGE